MTRSFTPWIALVCAALVACSDSGGVHAGKTAHWSYSGETGPARWGALDPAYEACGSGQKQSPIDILTSELKTGELPAVTLDYGTTPLDIVHNGHAIQVDVQGEHALHVAGEVFRLRQFHFHSPSEHTVDGEHAALEMHLVHQNDAGTLAVVGVLIEAGAENAALAPVWAHLPSAPGPAQAFPDATVELAKLLPDSLAGYRYEGSLTTPPCTEGVRWLVAKQPITLSQAQIAAFQLVLKGNDRPTQPLNGRVVRTDA